MRQHIKKKFLIAHRIRVYKYISVEHTIYKSKGRSFFSGSATLLFVLPSSLKVRVVDDYEVQYIRLCRERWLQLDPVNKDELRAVASLEYKTWYNNRKILQTEQQAKGPFLTFK
jgi:hypothetical protein